MIRLRRFITAVRRWFPPTVLVVSLLVLAAMLLMDGRVIPFEYEWGRHVGGTASTISFYKTGAGPAGTRGSYGISSWGGGKFRLWHHDIIESRVDLAINKINADLPANVPFRFTPSDVSIQVDQQARNSGFFYDAESGDLAFCWNDKYDFMGDLLPFSPAFGTYWTVDVSDTIPEAVLMLLAGWSGIVLLNRLSKRLQWRPGFCRECGYNLTANTSGVCPECGMRCLVKAPIVQHSEKAR